MNNLKKIRKICDKCHGEGEVSSCCNANLYANRCTVCGKFCHREPCHDCWGVGYHEYSIGDEVENFNQHKSFGEIKTFTGNIIKLLDRENAMIIIDEKVFTVKINNLKLK
jgi:hypothetical protein